MLGFGPSSSPVIGAIYLVSGLARPLRETNYRALTHAHTHTHINPPLKPRPSQHPPINISPLHRPPLASPDQSFSMAFLCRPVCVCVYFGEQKKKKICAQVCVCVCFCCVCCSAQSGTGTPMENTILSESFRRRSKKWGPNKRENRWAHGHRGEGTSSSHTSGNHTTALFRWTAGSTSGNES